MTERPASAAFAVVQAAEALAEVERTQKKVQSAVNKLEAATAVANTAEADVDECKLRELDAAATVEKARQALALAEDAARKASEETRARILAAHDAAVAEEDARMNMMTLCGHFEASVEGLRTARSSAARAIEALRDSNKSVDSLSRLERFLSEVDVALAHYSTQHGQVPDKARLQKQRRFLETPAEAKPLPSPPPPPAPAAGLQAQPAKPASAGPVHGGPPAASDPSELPPPPKPEAASAQGAAAALPVASGRGHNVLTLEAAREAAARSAASDEAASSSAHRSAKDSAPTGPADDDAAAPGPGSAAGASNNGAAPARRSTSPLPSRPVSPLAIAAQELLGGLQESAAAAAKAFEEAQKRHAEKVAAAEREKALQEAEEGRLAEEAERRRRAEEAEAERRRRDEEEVARIRREAEEEAAERRRRAAEDAARRKEEEAARKAAEEEAKMRAEQIKEEQRRRREEEEEAAAAQRREEERAAAIEAERRRRDEEEEHRQRNDVETLLKKAAAEAEKLRAASEAAEAEERKLGALEASSASSDGGGAGVGQGVPDPAAAIAAAKTGGAPQAPAGAVPAPGEPAAVGAPPKPAEEKKRSNVSTLLAQKRAQREQQQRLQEEARQRAAALSQPPQQPPLPQQVQQQPEQPPARAAESAAAGTPAVAATPVSGGGRDGAAELPQIMPPRIRTRPSTQAPSEPQSGGASIAPGASASSSTVVSPRDLRERDDGGADGDRGTKGSGWMHSALTAMFGGPPGSASRDGGADGSGSQGDPRSARVSQSSAADSHHLPPRGATTAAGATAAAPAVASLRAGGETPTAHGGQQPGTASTKGRETPSAADAVPSLDDPSALFAAGAGARGGGLAAGRESRENHAVQQQRVASATGGTPAAKGHADAGDGRQPDSESPEPSGSPSWRSVKSLPIAAVASTIGTAINSDKVRDALAKTLGIDPPPARDRGGGGAGGGGSGGSGASEAHGDGDLFTPTNARSLAPSSSKAGGAASGASSAASAMSSVRALAQGPYQRQGPPAAARSLDPVLAGAGGVGNGGASRALGGSGGSPSATAAAGAGQAQAGRPPPITAAAIASIPDPRQRLASQAQPAAVPLSRASAAAATRAAQQQLAEANARAALAAVTGVPSMDPRVLRQEAILGSRLRPEAAGGGGAPAPQQQPGLAASRGGGSSSDGLELPRPIDAQMKAQRVQKERELLARIQHLRGGDGGGGGAAAAPAGADGGAAIIRRGRGGGTARPGQPGGDEWGDDAWVAEDPRRARSVDPAAMRPRPPARGASALADSGVREGLDVDDDDDLLTEEDDEAARYRTADRSMSVGRAELEAQRSAQHAAAAAKPAERTYAEDWADWAAETVAALGYGLTEAVQAVTGGEGGVLEDELSEGALRARAKREELGPLDVQWTRGKGYDGEGGGGLGLMARSAGAPPQGEESWASWFGLS